MSTKSITYTGVMAAVIFTATSVIKLPSLTGGYTHIGDAMIFLAVYLLGRNKGAMAAGLGAAFSDLVGGYTFWILPTLVIKFGMAYILGSFLIKRGLSTSTAILGALLGGIFQIIGYFLVSSTVYGVKGAFLSVPGNIMQTAVGIIIFLILSKVLPLPSAFSTNHK